MKRLLIFVLLAPLIGFLVAFAPLVGAKYADMAFIFGLPFAYLFGFIPVLAGALIDGRLSNKLDYWPRVMVVALIGVILSSVTLPFLFVGLEGVHRWSGVDFSLIGGVPAAICSLLAGKILQDKTPLKGGR